MVGFSLVPSSAIASAVYVEQQPIKAGVAGFRIAQKIALFGQYNSGKTPTDYTPRLLGSADEALTLYGPGSMLHLMAKKAFAGAGAVPIYACPIPDDGSSGVKANGTITTSGTATAAGVKSIFIAGQKVTVSVAKDETKAQIATKIASAINAKTHLPVTASASDDDVTLTAKWAGATGNGITISQNLDTGDAEADTTGVTLTIVQMASGATDPDPADAFTALGTAFFTQVVYPYTATAGLAALNTAFDARIDPAIKMPFIAMIGNVQARADYVTTVDARNSEAETYVNAEASPNLPFEIAAAAVGVCARSAEVNPARPWKTLLLPGIRAGALPAWNLTQHDAVQAAGGGTTDKQLDGTVRIHDLVTSYKENALGAEDDAWRYPETIAVMQAKIYSLDTLFRSEPFVRGVVVDDDSVTPLPYAVRPKTVKSYLIKLVDDLWIPEGWSKERDAIVASIVAEIDSTNAGRINASLTDVMSAGLRIIAMLYQWALAAA